MSSRSNASLQQAIDRVRCRVRVIYPYPRCRLRVMIRRPKSSSDRCGGSGQPAPGSHHRSARFEQDHGRGERSRHRQPVASHFARRGAEVERLDDSSLQVRRAEQQQPDLIHPGRRESLPRLVHQTAQQLQPNAPQKLFRSDTGSRLAQALRWRWACRLQSLAQAQAGAALRSDCCIGAPASPQPA
jgi:hypothetical protein